MNRKQKRSLKKKSKRSQRGGTAFQHFWRAPFVSSCQLNKYGIPLIDQAPMFKPWLKAPKLPTPTTGITPTGAYLLSSASVTPLDLAGAIKPKVGGGKRKSKKSQAKKSRQ